MQGVGCRVQGSGFTALELPHNTSKPQGQKGWVFLDDAVPEAAVVATFEIESHKSLKRVGPSPACFRVCTKKLHPNVTARRDYAFCGTRGRGRGSLRR